MLILILGEHKYLFSATAAEGKGGVRDMEGGGKWKGMGDEGREVGEDEKGSVVGQLWLNRPYKDK